jgi:hypothetical protein
MGFDKCHVESRRTKGQQSCKLFVEIESISTRMAGLFSWFEIESLKLILQFN